MGKLLKIKGDDNFVKDTETGILLNINNEEILAARKRKEIRNMKVGLWMWWKKNKLKQVLLHNKLL